MTKRTGRISFYLCIFLWTVCMLTACAKENVVNQSVCVTVLCDDASVSQFAFVRADRGTDISLKLSIADGYGFAGCDYRGQYSVDRYEGEIVLCLYDVKFDTRLKVTTNKITDGMFYYLNGGSFCSEKATGDYYLRFADLSHHLRANTDTAMGVIYRDGYTQIGWNMREDGTGIAVGLGSRVTVDENSPTCLYAQWVQWDPADNFSYEEDNITADPDDIVLTDYLGKKSKSILAIPGEIDGRRVVGIKAGFANRLQIETLVLPNTMVYVERGAFESSTIDEIYFFDNLETIFDKSFSSGIKTVHINAVLAPRYSTNCDHAQFAENMDRLILHADEKKMVFFAGCSMAYGLRSDLVEAAFDGEYTICNMGVIGGTNAAFQLDCITAYLRNGDVFVHAPEEMSNYQLMDNIRSEVRIFYCVESNYDLLTLCDLSRTELFFNHFTEFNRGRAQAENIYTYSDFNGNYNAYGDIIIPRSNSEEDASFGIAECFLPECVNTNSIKRLKEKYDAIAAKGATVFFSFAPINENALSENDHMEKIWERFESNICRGLNGDCTVISNVEDYIMPGKLFYDEDYHLSNEGAIVRTQKLVCDIRTALEQTKSEE